MDAIFDTGTSLVFLPTKEYFSFHTRVMEDAGKDCQKDI